MSIVRVDSIENLAGTSVLDVSNINTASVSLVSDMRTGSWTGVKQISVTGERGQPQYYLDASDTTSVDNDVSVVVDTGGNRWKAAPKRDGFSLASHVSQSAPSATISAAIADLINYSIAKGRYGLDVSGIWTLSETLQMPSGFELFGVGPAGASLELTGVNGPIIASKAWFAANAISPSGAAKLRNLRLIGDGTQASNHGVVLFDYYSVLDDVRTYSTGGDGIKLTHTKDDATPAGGTLVENRIQNCHAVNPKGHCFNLGVDGNNKLTDGFLLNCVADSAATDLTKSVVLLGSAAGWNIHGMHTYGNTVNYAFELLNGFHTNISNVYIETFKVRGFSLAKSQRGINLSNISVKASSADAGAAVILADKSSLVTDTVVNVSNLTVQQESAVAVNVFETITTATQIKCSSLSKTGTNKASLSTRKGGTNVIALDDSIVNSSALQTGVWGANSSPLAQYNHSGRRLGNTAQTATFNVTLPNYGKWQGILTVQSNSFDNGAARASYVAAITVSAKVNGTDAWVVMAPIVLSAASGFASNPVVTASNVSGNNGTVTITWTFTDADAAGAATMLHGTTDYTAT